MITAQEARDMIDAENKTLWFKLRLWWICGIINNRIKKAADNGETYIELTKYWNEHPSFRHKYFPIIKKCYNKLGFYVGTSVLSYYSNVPVISWKYPIDEQGQQIYKDVASNNMISYRSVYRSAFSSSSNSQ